MVLGKANIYRLYYGEGKVLETANKDGTGEGKHLQIVLMEKANIYRFFRKQSLVSLMDSRVLMQVSENAIGE